jgi:hypothetical protein
MARFKIPKQTSGGGGTPSVRQTFDIVEPRCKVCTHPQRREIDMMLALGWSQADVIRHWNNIMELQGLPKSEFFMRNGMSTHVKKHLSIKDAAIRRIIEARARAEGLDIELVEGFILTKQGVAEALIAAGLESLHRGDTTVEPKDILTAIKIISELEADRVAQAEEVMLQEIKAFTAAVKKVVPEEKWKEIYEAYEQELGKITNLAIMPANQDIPEEEENEEIEEELPDQLRLFDVEEL